MGSLGKVYVADNGEDPDLAVITLAQARLLFTRITTYYATEPERTTETATPSKMSTAEKLGMPAYVDARKGLSFWDGTAWQWVPIHKPDVATRPSVASIDSTTPLSILSNSVDLPTGNRNVEIKAGCVVSAGAQGGGTPGWNARAYVVGTNLGNGMIGDRLLGFVGDVDAMHRSWDLVCSGTITYTVWGLNSNGTGVCNFTDTWLTIIDHGPA